MLTLKNKLRQITQPKLQCLIQIKENKIIMILRNLMDKKLLMNAINLIHQKRLFHLQPIASQKQKIYKNH